MIRVAQASDARQLMKLREVVYRETDKMLYEPEEYRPSVFRERKFIRLFTEPDNSLLLVAPDSRQLNGYLGAMGGSLSKNRHAAQVMLAVRKSHWRQGLATAMLTELVRWAKQDSTLTRLSLTVSVDNSGALELYQHCGFEIEGRLRHLYRNAEGEYHDELAMALLCSPTA